MLFIPRQKWVGSAGEDREERPLGIESSFGSVSILFSLIKRSISTDHIAIIRLEQGKRGGRRPSTSSDSDISSVFVAFIQMEDGWASEREGDR